ncbi:hypothetical protein [Jatrophihabitans lederbergiae]|uniref:VCBS repeat-containing protein n=1 Tax=Jatrophihabitans lederbergiae TaxID=3075547 RepID=A0ABU2JBP8_9ACTN|nr:hypothetical protein [Jatrophihabitans sp. DSM 44399]MDT0261904.1 hypothetical protein [Jatrophihabitans sp. DSM 44399]
MSKLASRSLHGRRHLSMLAVAGLIGMVLAAGCSTHGGPGSAATSAAQNSSSQNSSSQNSSSQSSSVPASAAKPPCQQYACTPQPPVALNADYAVRLWSSSATAASGVQNLRSTPVLELVRTSGGTSQHVQWWVGRLGYGWTATLVCAAGQHPNCVVSSSVGSHAGNAEVVQLRGSALVSSPATSVTFDSGVPRAADLNGDGYLDVAGLDNDYKPNFATGHNFWTTYRFTGGALHQTGCTPQKSIHQVAPTVLLTGPCPMMPSD